MNIITSISPWKLLVASKTGRPMPLLPAHPLFKNLTGLRFGRLRVIRYAGRTGEKRISSWFCKCDCGNDAIVLATRLQTGTTMSCGCYHRERWATARKTHGKSKTSTYQSWCNMKERCENPCAKSYAYYGGRGIQVCTKWAESFDAFLADMGLRPQGRYEIDRIDNEGNYEAGNCRWVKRIQNARNKRSNRKVTFEGRTLCIAEWAEVTGLPRYVIEKRLRVGWSVRDTLTKAIRPWVRKVARKRIR